MLGKVYLVGGGPGDPDLLTIKALKIMQSADVIVYDYLISDDVLALCSETADKISVGKKAGAHSVPQDQTNQILVDLAFQGKNVCRLKGGDPYIFGRGGEEAQVLVQNGISFEVIPGITAASACSASTGIPLTHRDYAQSVQFITGHHQAALKNSNDPAVDWQNLAQSNQTLVIYMGIIRSAEIQQQLLQNGRAPETPVAIVEKGSRPDQRVVTGQLNELESLIKTNHIGSPALIIIGEVVKIRNELTK